MSSGQIRTKRHFIPRNRGDLEAALASRAAFVTEAPRSPRPLAYFDDRTLAGLPHLSARDVAVHETLVTAAFELDRFMTTPITVLVEKLLTVLSTETREAPVRELVASLARLGIPPPTPLRRRDSLIYTPPEWVRTAFEPWRRHNQPYGYIDLAALAQFRHRASALLYVWVAGQLRGQTWHPDQPSVCFSLTPREFLRILGVRSTHVPMLRKRALEPAVAELAELVTAWTLQLEEERDARGAVTAWAFVLGLAPKSRRETRTPKLPADERAFYRERPDIVEYRVSTSTWSKLRALPALDRKTYGNGTTKRPRMVDSEIERLREVWLVALCEALTGCEITPAHHVRECRGDNLLRLIEQRGPNEAFWTLAMSELAAPDLLDYLAKPEHRSIVNAAEDARRTRHDAAKAENKRARKAANAEAARVRRESERHDRAAGLRPPLTRITKPEPLASAELPTTTEEAAALLTSPSARAEANALYRLITNALDFPRTQGSRIFGELVHSLARHAPTIAKADALLGGPLADVIGRSARVAAEIGGKDDLARHEIAILVSSPLILIRNGYGHRLAETIASNIAHVDDRRRKRAIEGKRFQPRPTIRPRLTDDQIREIRSILPKSEASPSAATTAASPETSQRPRPPIPKGRPPILPRRR